MSDKNIRLPSSVPPLTGYLGIVVVIALFFLWPDDISFLSYSHQAVIFLLILFGCMALYELVFAKTYKAPETELDFAQPIHINKVLGKDFALKILGVLVGLSLVTIFYWVADIYNDGWYRPFFQLIFDNIFSISVILFAYFAFVHLFMTKPQDAYWQLGAFVLNLGRQGDKDLIRDLLLGLLIKAFFLPLMFCYFLDDWNYLRDFNWSASPGFDELFRFTYKFLFFLDLAFVVIGYVFTARLFNAHIRWTEKNIGGWVVCLLCYMPFWQVFGRSYFGYGDGLSWQGWLAGGPIYYSIWGSLILFLSAIYVLSEAQFGLRFSNLTYRGLISHGTFRFTKHPAYISKNLSWWMLDIPFIAADWTIAVRNCLALLGINAIYFFRARYEENCLKSAPEYQNYMDFIDRNGALSKLKSVIFGRFIKKIKKN